MLYGGTSKEANAFDSVSEPVTKKKKRLNVQLVPYLNYTRAFGAVGGLGPIAMYKVNPDDTKSPDSIGGGFALLTGNGSGGAAAFTQLYFDEDRWRISAILGSGDINSQFYTGLPFFDLEYIDYGLTGDVFFLEIKRRLFKNTFIGFNYSYADFDNNFDLNIINLTHHSTLQGVGTLITTDTRDSVYFPTTGHRIMLRYRGYYEALGNTGTSHSIKLIANKYIPLRGGKNVLALRGYAAVGLGDVNFNRQFTLRGTDLRGYTQNEFRGTELFDIQAEYRHKFTKKWGGVVFAGVGTVYGSWVKANNGVLLPSAGVGIRYEVFKKNRLNIGLDIAKGKDDWGMYFRLGEAF